jgi:hypothetical protein
MGGVWYVVPGNGQDMTASLCSTLWDSQISVFSGTSCSSLTCIGGNDDDGPSCIGTSASITWTTTVGINYYILIHGFNANNSFTLALTCVGCNTPIPTGSATQTFCSSSTPTIASLIATGTDIKWYYVLRW